MTAVGSAEAVRPTVGPDELLWVTNVPTPYRAPLWSAIGARHRLSVAVLADHEENRAWSVDVDESRYSLVRLNAVPLTRSNGTAIYGVSVPLLRLVAGRPRAMVLDGWESPAFLAARVAARRLRVPLIASYRSTLATHRFSGGPVDALRRWFFRGADAVLTAGRASTDAVLSMGVPRTRIVEGFNTVDVRRFEGGAARLRADSPVARPGHHFLYVGQFIARKNVASLLVAFAGARAEGDTLTLVGGGPLEGELRRTADRLGLGRSVRFTGHLDGDDLVAAYAAADTLVLPSTEEVWGLVVNEALAAGLHAVVSTACGITPSIAHMPGVFGAAPTAAELEGALRRSRQTWRGPITGHPVTRHTPDALGTVVLGAMDRISGPNGALS